jgi:hypothetical protein
VSKAAKSVFSFAFVFIIGGLGLLLAPHIVLPLLGLPSTHVLFVRLLGMVMLILAYYYIRASMRELTDFFMWTVHARTAGLVFYLVFYLLDLAPLVVIGFGVIDLIGALWTWWAIANDKVKAQRA